MRPIPTRGLLWIQLVFVSLCSQPSLCPPAVHGAGEAGAGAPGPAAQEADHGGLHPRLDGIRAGPGAVRHPALRGARRLPPARELPQAQARSEGLRGVCVYERAFWESRLCGAVTLL